MRKSQQGSWCPAGSEIPVFWQDPERGGAGGELAVEAEEYVSLHRALFGLQSSKDRNAFTIVAPSLVKYVVYGNTRLPVPGSASPLHDYLLPALPVRRPRTAAKVLEKACRWGFRAAKLAGCTEREVDVCVKSAAGQCTRALHLDVGTSTDDMLVKKKR